MIRWVLVFWLAPVWFVCDGWLAEALWAIPALTLALCLALAWFVRAGSLPGLLVALALARSVLLGGDAALHVLALGMPVAVLLPVRALVFRRRWFWQALAAAFLAVTVPKATAVLAPLGVATPQVMVLGWSQLLCAVAVVPPLAWVLRALPPLRSFREPDE